MSSRLPGYCSALGRALLAGLAPAQAQRRIRMMDRVALTERTVVDVKVLDEMVTRCRDLGHSLSDGEIETAVRSMAVPIRTSSGEPMAAMSISVRADRMTFADFEAAFLPRLKRCRDQLASRLNS